MNRAERRAAGKRDNRSVPQNPGGFVHIRRGRNPVPTPYKVLVREVRQFHRDQLLQMIGAFSARWDGTLTNPPTPPHPWDLATLAVVALDVGRNAGRRATANDVNYLASHAANLEHPEPTNSPESALRLVSRLLYQQWPLQNSGLDKWARPRALLLDTPFPDRVSPKVLVAGWDVELFGCTLDDFVQTGFMLKAGAAQSGGRLPLEWQGLDEVSRFLPKDVVDRVAAEWFTQDLRTVQATIRRSRSEHGLQALYGTNPLIMGPFVRGLETSEPLAPLLPLVEQRSSILGILYAGLDKWDVAFTNEVGHLVEEYVGRHLRLIEGATVHPQIRYTVKKDRFDSIDWFVVTDTAVLLIEVKSALPSEGIRAGAEDFFTLHNEKLGKAIRQINRTVDAIRSGHPKFSHIPANLPLLAFVVTLGSFYMANDALTRERLEGAHIPLGYLAIDDLERVVTLPQDDFASILTDAHAKYSQSRIIDDRGLLKNRPFRPNPIMEAAWESIPLIKWIDQHHAKALRNEPTPPASDDLANRGGE